MIVVTGGAGFIGSNLIWKLNQLGRTDIIVVDLPDKRNHDNLRGLVYSQFMGDEEFASGFAATAIQGIEIIYHLGACSDTTCTDWNYLQEFNTEYTLRLIAPVLQQDIRFVYASSAATYGDGSHGYSDSHDVLESLEPLNLYARSKHEFDLIAYREGFIDRIAGLKYFNVYGPNEYHKGDMRSMVCKGYEQIRDTGKLVLFKSDRPEFPDGGQDRDFIYVKDAVDMTLFVGEHPEINGIFNVGTGEPATWNMLAKAIFDALGLPPSIEYIDMPEHLKGKYQYHTQAEMGKLHAAGYSKPVTPFADAVADYVRNYLVEGAHLVIS
jgi:ADP-L-glycero-D-manno-heptose 6-epimerase